MRQSTSNCRSEGNKDEGKDTEVLCTCEMYPEDTFS